jgi:hypothetical protein
VDAVDIIRTRIVTTTSLALANIALLRAFRPTRKQVECAALTAFAAASADFLIEAVMKRLRLWEYRLSGSVGGMPLDLFADFFLWVMAYCTGYSVLDSRESPPRIRALYAGVITALLGTWALMKNKDASEKGYVKFAAEGDAGTPWFVVGNYLSILTVIALVTLTYEYARRCLLPEVEGGA